MDATEPPSDVRHSALVRRYAAAVRRVAAEPPSPADEARRLVLRVLAGEIGAVPLEPLPDAPANVALPAAGALGVLQCDAEALAILVRFSPAGRGDAVAAALRVVPRVPTATALVHRSWILALVDALIAAGSDRLGPFMRALQTSGHFELLDAIRRSPAWERLGDTERWLLEARNACWTGAYDALRGQLDGAPADRAVAADVALLAAIVRGARGETNASLSALADLHREGGPTVRDVAGRWIAELRVRRSRHAKSDLAWWRSLLEPLARRRTWSAEQAALGAASDHPVIRLVHWIAMSPERTNGEREVIRDFHEWVIAGLARERVAGIDPLVAEWRRDGSAATLWKIVDLFGGNRESCTVVEDGRLRALDVRTARQEAVEIQRRLRHVGLDALLRRFGELAAEWPRLVVFRTYGAELLLWAGRYEEAAAVFDEVRRASVNRWAQVGLGAALAGLGRTAEAERVWEEGLRVHHGALPGEASLVYRAEAALEGGRLDAADQLLRGVLAAKPTRLRGCILAAELAWLRGDTVGGRAGLLEAAAMCPGLGDAAAPLALADLLQDPSAPQQRDAAIARCRALRSAMRGNASSWLYTWYDAAGALHAFHHVQPRDLELVLERFECLDAGVPRPSSQAVRDPRGLRA